MYFLCLGVLLPLLSSAETTHIVKVGSDGLNIDPDNVKAEVGDIVNFEFYPNNHSITQSSYDEPCVPLFGSTGVNPIFSGFFPVNTKDGEKEASKIFSININNTDPIWLYCAQGSHCQDGQVMVINQKYTLPEPHLGLTDLLRDDSDQTLEKYKDASSKTEQTSSPVEVFGGLVMDHESDDDEEPKTTKGNPGTPATATMSTSTSMTATHSSSTVAHTNAALQLRSRTGPVCVAAIFGLAIPPLCGFLA